MIQIDPFRYKAAPGEQITLKVLPAQAPSVLAFSQEGQAASYDDELSFAMPSSSTYITGLFEAPGADQPARWDVRITGSAGGTFLTSIRAEGSGPVTVTFSFDTDWAGPR